MKQPKLSYRFHNPNTPEASADFLTKLLIESNAKKVEGAIMAAAKKPLDKTLAECQKKADVYNNSRESRPRKTKSFDIN